MSYIFDRKKIIAGVFCGFLLVGSVFAEGSSSNGWWVKEVEFYDFDLTLEKKNDGSTKISWNDFDKDLDFQWYKLMHSTTNPNPVYPDQSAAFVGSKDDTSTSLWLKAWKTHYVRICAITLEEEYRKWRYCSETQQLIIADTQKSSDTKKEVKAVKVHSEKKEVKTINASAKKNNSELSDEIKARIDLLLEDFISRLEGKDYSDAQMINSIDAVIIKLAEYKDNARYTKMVKYMIGELEEYRSKYNDLDIFEDLLNDF